MVLITVLMVFAEISGALLLFVNGFSFDDVSFRFWSFDIVFAFIFWEQVG